MIETGTVLLHDNTRAARPSLLFEKPKSVLSTRNAGEAVSLLRAAESALASGSHIAGFLSYELGYLLCDRLTDLLPAEAEFPLFWLGVFDAPRELSRAECSDWLTQRASTEHAEISLVEPSMSRDEYGVAFRRAQDYIRAGDAYQINLTLRARFNVSGDPVSLYRDLCRAQTVAHGALLSTGEHHILSLSPELFVENHRGNLVTRPMKGTSARGRTLAEDLLRAETLAASAKDRAENLMIVDLLRNDLARVAQTGSVAVSDMFKVETYRHFHAMTSTVSATMREGTGFRDIAAALFPCGSVTGAPKIRAMQIIHGLEGAPRGVYCGSIGHLAPDGNFSFNVAIRTAVIGIDGAGEIGTGGGVTADSGEQAEYDEALLKLRFLDESRRSFGLIETLLWDGEGFFLLERHMRRLESSALHFGIAFEREGVVAALAAAVSASRGQQRVRLVLDDDGVNISKTPLAAMVRLRFTLAKERVDSGDRFLYHKTTRREFYDRTRVEAAEAASVDEVVFLNEREELTEGSFTNLFIRSGSKLLTPALDSGLLPGTLREDLLARGEAEEAVLTVRDLESADEIYLGNSVRGLLKAEWLENRVR